MACYRPVTVWQPIDGGPILFHEKKDCREFKIPCNKCIGCRIDKREEWATRIYCESKMHEKKSFVTLTYDDEHLPADGGLNYRHIQLLHKSMRKEYGPFRFFVAGEYGEKNKRPHYHGIYFGLDFPDKLKSNGMLSAHDLFRSEVLERLWKRGQCAIGEVNYASSRYCATYTVKRVSGDLADTIYSRVNVLSGEIVTVQPEFAKMSLKPGLGTDFLKKYYPEMYVAGHNAVFVGEKKKKIPGYFDRLMSDMEPDLYEAVKFDRQKEAEKYADNNTRERLEVRENVKKAKERFDKERKGYDL